MSIYMCIDLKSFYASVECHQRHLDPLTTNLVVADPTRTDQTICLAVSPSLKAYGLSGRSRLYEVVSKVKQVNDERRRNAPHHLLLRKSYDAIELENKQLEVDYIVAEPQMAKYIEYSSKIYDIYLKYISEEDIHIYSIDEVFCDITSYLKSSNKNPVEFTSMIIHDVLNQTGITATAGIGINMYLAKIAMDIVAKKKAPDENGVRIAVLNQKLYRELLWDHTPLTDFWRVGKGMSKKLEAKGLYTMGDIALCSIGGEKDFYNEDLLYKMFGVNAELLIDHAWGYEPTTIKDIKAYKPSSTSLGVGQVLTHPYQNDKARIVLKEMVDSLALDLVKKNLVCKQFVLTVGYDIENTDFYKGEIKVDFYGRRVPKSAHGTTHFENYTSSSTEMISKAIALYDKITDPILTIRRINISVTDLKDASSVSQCYRKQLSLFNYEDEQDTTSLKKEKDVQKAMLDIKLKYGKNAVLKGTDFEEGATQRERNDQIGGHKA